MTLRFPTKVGVENCNRNKLESLQGHERAYLAMDSAGYDIMGFPIKKQDAATLLIKVNTPAVMLLKVFSALALSILPS